MAHSTVAREVDIISRKRILSKSLGVKELHASSIKEIASNMKLTNYNYLG